MKGFVKFVRRLENIRKFCFESFKRRLRSRNIQCVLVFPLTFVKSLNFTFAVLNRTY